MNRNVSNLDRVLRGLLVAPAAIAAAVVVGTLSAAAGMLLFAFAAIMLATSVIGFCPLYALLRVNTRGGRPLPH
jgi:hypothetical protein